MNNKLNETIKSKKIGLIIYARMSSKRFPGKVLKKFYLNQNILDLIVYNLKKFKLTSNIVIATSREKSDSKIISFCKKNKIQYFSGSNQNVFLRTLNCINKHNFK